MDERLTVIFQTTSFFSSTGSACGVDTMALGTVPALVGPVTSGEGEFASDTTGGDGLALGFEAIPIGALPWEEAISPDCS
mmetsp:Transcript_4672/g.11056  ORF Transcript_4672/g.11056 Transcript_4672/m.11056 type:complete len:80 (-) Transcript_4672:239-478(-)